jgi:hypothetical protein
VVDSRVSSARAKPIVEGGGQSLSGVFHPLAAVEGPALHGAAALRMLTIRPTEPFLRLSIEGIIAAFRDLPPRIALTLGLRRAGEQPAALGAQPGEYLVDRPNASSNLFSSTHRASTSGGTVRDVPAFGLIAAFRTEAVVRDADQREEPRQRRVASLTAA